MDIKWSWMHIRIDVKPRIWKMVRGVWLNCAIPAVILRSTVLAIASEASPSMTNIGSSLRISIYTKHNIVLVYSICFILISTFLIIINLLHSQEDLSRHLMQLFLKKCDQIDRFLGKVSCERHSVRIFFLLFYLFWLLTL